MTFEVEALGGSLDQMKGLLGDISGFIKRTVTYVSTLVLSCHGMSSASLGPSPDARTGLLDLSAFKMVNEIKLLGL